MKSGLRGCHKQEGNDHMADDECKLAGRRPKRNPKSRTLESPAFKDFIERCADRPYPSARPLEKAKDHHFADPPNRPRIQGKTPVKKYPV